MSFTRDAGLKLLEQPDEFYVCYLSIRTHPITRPNLVGVSLESLGSVNTIEAKLCPPVPAASSGRIADSHIMTRRMPPACNSYVQGGTEDQQYTRPPPQGTVLVEAPLGIATREQPSSHNLDREESPTAGSESPREQLDLYSDRSKMGSRRAWGGGLFKTGNVGKVEVTITPPVGARIDSTAIRETELGCPSRTETCIPGVVSAPTPAPTLTRKRTLVEMSGGRASKNAYRWATCSDSRSDQDVGDNLASHDARSRCLTFIHADRASLSPLDCGSVDADARSKGWVDPQGSSFPVIEVPNAREGSRGASWVLNDQRDVTETQLTYDQAHLPARTRNSRAYVERPGSVDGGDIGQYRAAWCNYVDRDTWRRDLECPPPSSELHPSEANGFLGRRHGGARGMIGDHGGCGKGPHDRYSNGHLAGVETAPAAMTIDGRRRNPEGREGRDWYGYGDVGRNDGQCYGDSWAERLPPQRPTIEDVSDKLTINRGRHGSTASRPSTLSTVP